MYIYYSICTGTLNDLWGGREGKSIAMKRKGEKAKYEFNGEQDFLLHIYLATHQFGLQGDDRKVSTNDSLSSPRFSCPLIPSQLSQRIDPLLTSSSSTTTTTTTTLLDEDQHGLKAFRENKLARRRRGRTQKKKKQGKKKRENPSISFLLPPLLHYFTHIYIYPPQHVTQTTTFSSTQNHPVIFLATS